MRIIYKYDIPIQDSISIEMPELSRILSFQNQNGKGVVWALVNPDFSLCIRRFRIYGTGHPVIGVRNRTYIGTAQFNDLVWHLFEE